MWGPKKEAEAAPPALGRKLPPRVRAGRSEGRDLSLHSGFLSIHKEVGGGFPAAPAQRVPRPGYCEASQVAGQPGEGSRDQLWSGRFLNRVGTHHARPP